MPYVNTIERYERAKAVHEGVEGTLRKLIILKFGEIPEWAHQRLASATDAQLDDWVAQILTADSLDALLGKH